MSDDSITPKPKSIFNYLSEINRLLDVLERCANDDYVNSNVCASGTAEVLIFTLIEALQCYTEKDDYQFILNTLCNPRVEKLLVSSKLQLDFSQLYRIMLMIYRKEKPEATKIISESLKSMAGPAVIQVLNTTFNRYVLAAGLRIPFPEGYQNLKEEWNSTYNL